MFLKFVFLVAFFVLEAKTADLRLSLDLNRLGDKIYDQVLEAGPAIWKRTDEILVEAPPNQVISAIFITDLRDDKDGEVNLDKGGIGSNSVTIGLKSPTVLRGYQFRVQVYARSAVSGLLRDRGYTKGGSYVLDDRNDYGQRQNYDYSIKG